MEYSSSEIAKRIKIQAKQRGKILRHLLKECNLSINMISRINNGTDISSMNLAKIADALDCSVDYLLGRTDTPEINR